MGRTMELAEVGDRDSWEAIEYAQEYRDMRGFTFDKAEIDRHDGLLLIGKPGAYHFTNALCGYGGSGPHATARILELFEFGTFDEVFAKIDHGGESAHYILYR